MLWSAPWFWFAVALALGILEIMAPGYILLGFAVSAAIVGVMFFFDGFVAAALKDSLPMTLVVFAALALISWVAMRQIFGKRTGQAKTFDKDINDN